MTQLRILVTSAGRRVGLIESFRTAAAALGTGLQVHACDLMPQRSAACLSADQCFPVPLCTSPDYVDFLLTQCRTRRIDLLVPTIDPELPVLSRAAERFAAIGCRVLVAEPPVVDIARDKRLTTATLGAAHVPVPRTFSLKDLQEDEADIPWPVFAKPVNGSASRGLSVIWSPDHIPENYDEPMVFQEFLSGPEYTVNVFVDAQGTLRTAVPHQRLSTRAGEVEKGRTVRDPRFAEIARDVVGALPGFRGVLCFQLIDDPDRGPRVFEINARFGGGYPLADRAGATFARWLLEELLGRESSAHDDWREGVEMIRFDAALYLDAAGAVT